MENSMVLITDRPLNPESVTAQVRAPANGGVVTFLGTTREETEGRPVRFLEYEAYPEMAEKEIRKIFRELEERWGVTEAAVAHRIGHLEIGEISMVVAVATPHRREAFSACWQAVDRIKETVPIWKKEFFEDGAVWVGCGTDAHEVVHAHGGGA